MLKVTSFLLARLMTALRACDSGFGRGGAGHSIKAFAKQFNSISPSTAPKARPSPLHIVILTDEACVPQIREWIALVGYLISPTERPLKSPLKSGRAVRSPFQHSNRMLYLLTRTANQIFLYNHW